MSESPVTRRLYMSGQRVWLDDPAPDAPRFEVVEVVEVTEGIESDSGKWMGWAVIDRVEDNPAGDMSVEIIDSKRRAERVLAQRLRRDQGSGGGSDHLVEPCAYCGETATFGGAQGLAEMDEMVLSSTGSLLGETGFYFMRQVPQEGDPTNAGRACLQCCELLDLVRAWEEGEL